MERDREGSIAQFHHLSEKRENLVLARMISGEQVSTALVPDDVVGEELVHRVHVAFGEGLVTGTDKSGVGMLHATNPSGSVLPQHKRRVSGVHTRGGQYPSPRRAAG